MPMFNRPGLPMDPRYGNVSFGALPTNDRGENPHDVMQRKNRMQAFESRMAEFPGAAPGGTGATGIQPNLGITGLGDWTDLLEQQQQYASDAGGGPITQRGGYGGYGSRGETANDALRQLQSLGGGGRRSSGGIGQLPFSRSDQARITRTIADDVMGDPGADALQQLIALQRGQVQQSRDPRLAALQTAGIGEDVADLQSGREADRFFSPGQKGMRAEQERLSLAPVQAEAAGKQAVAMLDNETKLLLAQLGIREQELENLSAQDVAALRGLAQVMSGEYAAPNLEDPRAAPFAGRLGLGMSGGGGGGSF